MTNEELIRKATITTDQMASAGLLNAEQSSKFIDYVIDETSMKEKVRVVKFKPSQMTIEKLNVANRVAVAKAQATDPGLRRGVSTSKVTLEHHEIMVPFEIGDTVKEENIEGDNVEDHIIKMMATALANNLEEGYWDGNTTGHAVLESELLEGGSSSLYIKDQYLALYNGWLKNAESGHVVDAAGAAISKGIFSQALNAMPRKFKKDKSKLKFMLSSDHEQEYRDFISSRIGKAADDALEGKGTLPAYGVDLMPVPLLSPTPIYTENVAANSDGTSSTSLSYAPITNLVIIPTTLADNPLAKYVITTDYTQDLANGTWIRETAGAIPSGGTVKCTYNTGGRILLTNLKNMIVAIGREIRIERARNIFRTVNEFAITVKTFATFEETDAVVLVKNLAVPS
jgi:hypothetical protein